MAGMTSANIISAARVALREGTASIWSDNDMTAYMATVAREISRKYGLRKRANLAIVEYTKEVDLGDLAYIEILQVEYPVGNGSLSPVYRPFQKFGSTLALDLSDTPDITDGTLTGTVTFTQNSRSVTGSGTAFSTELDAGDLLCVGKVASAAYKWYQIAEVVSDTALTLVEPFEEANNTDTVSLTKYRDADSCARIYYTGDYTVSTTSDMPAKYDELAILGIVAHAATEYASDAVKDMLVDITTKIGLANTQAGLATARLVQAATDLASARTNFNTSAITTAMTSVDTALGLVATDLASGRTNFNTAAITTAMAAVDTALAQVITDMTAARTNFATAAITTDMASAETALDKCTTDIAAGIVLINTSNVGGNVTNKYTEAAKADIEEARARVEKVKAYISEPFTNIEMGKVDVEEARMRLEKVKGYIAEPVPNIDSARAGVDETRALLDKVRAYIEEPKPNIDIAAQEISDAAGYVNQALSYLQMADRDMNSDRMVTTYQRWAEKKWNSYQEQLNNVGSVKVRHFGQREI